MSRSCQQCGKAFESASAHARFCGATCRKASSRGAPKVTELRAPVVQPGQGTAAQVRAQLESAGRLETYLGAAAIALAERIDSATAVMGFAALVKELRSTMDAALAGVQREASPLDEIKARRDLKRIAG
jgi:hypothetical protein